MQQAVRTLRGKCSICHGPIYEYHTDLRSPYPVDMDCGGDCWSCVAEAEDRQDEVARGVANIDQPIIHHIKQSDILKCPFAIIWYEHYHEDGSCKCDDPDERARMTLEWEYTEQDFIDAGILEANS